MKNFHLPLSVHTTNHVAKSENIDNTVPPANLSDLSATGNRVRTYTYWPSTSSVNVFELARAGFVFTGMDDIVKCYKCQGTLKKWKPGDDPLEGHKEFYPDCPHVIALNANKKPINTETQLEDLLSVCNGVGYRLRQLRAIQSKASGVEPGRKAICNSGETLECVDKPSVMSAGVPSLLFHISRGLRFCPDKICVLEKKNI